MAPDARERLTELGEEGLVLARAWIKREATRKDVKADAFRDALRARTRWALATPALLALNATVFVLMMFGPAAMADPDTITSWGGNFWLRTRNGEWWRLVTAMFVHAGLLQLAINMAGLAQVGLIVERLAGPFIVLAVFLAAGIFGNVVHLNTHPLSTSYGASSAVFGLYGLLLASWVWGVRRRSEVTIPLTMLKRLGAVFAVFLLYNVWNDSVGSGAELTGL